MINILKTIKVNTCISALKIINNEIYALDASFLLNIYSNENFSILRKHLLIKEENTRHAYDKSYDIGANVKTYISKNTQSKGTLFSQKNGKLIGRDSLDFHENAVTVSRFSNDSKLLAIGDEDGKVFFYDLDIKKVLFSFDPRADAISCISFSKNDRYTCVSSYDKTIIIYDIDRNKEISNKEVSDVVEDSIFIENSSNIAGITRDKKIFIHDTKTNETRYADFEFDEWPSVIKELGHKHFLVGTRGDTLYLIRSDTLELIKEIKSENLGVKTLNTYENKLYIGYVDGKIEIVDMMHLYEDFEIFLKLNKFEEATELIEKNILLLTHKIIKKYDTVWDQVLDMAKGHLIKKNFDGALKLVKPFFFDKKKEEEYNFLNSNKDDIAYFIKLVKEEKDVTAFKFADEHIYLKDTKEYTIIEKKWQKVYQVCRAMFEKNDLESSQKAIDTLNRYVGIESKKTQAKNLMLNYKHFIRAQKLVKARNFRLYFILTQKNPFLAQEDLYKKVTQLGQQTYLKLIDHEQNEEFEKANNIAKYLLDFTDFKEKANEHIDSMHEKQNLIQCIEIDDVDGVYNTVSDNEELENFKSFINYHKIYDGNKDIAIESAKDGKTEDVHQVFHRYLDIDYLESSMAFVFKLSYLSEMENAAKEDFTSIHWIDTIRRYTSLYDWDSEILAFAKEFDLNDVVMNSNVKFEKSSAKVEFFESILVYT